MLRLPDGTRLTVRENSQLALTALQTQTGTSAPPSKLKLIAGKFWSAFTAAVGHNLEIETPTSVAGVRGTEFQMSAGKSDSSLAVYDGKVGIAAGGKDADVPAGFAIVAAKTLGPLRPLPPAPQNLMPFQGKITGGIAHLKWDPVAKAVGYRFELARDVRFTNVFFEQNFVGQQIRVEAPPGIYYWRVFARDDADIEGAPSKLYAIEFLAD